MVFIKGQKAPAHNNKCLCFRCSKIPYNKGHRIKPLDISRIYYDEKDKSIFEKYTWQIEKRNKGKEYLAFKDENNKKVYFHRLIIKARIGQFVDHINGNGLDNRRINLRIVTNAQNNYNRRPKYNFKRVFYLKRINKYMASIMFKRKTIYLGVFIRPEDAAKAYNKKAKELFGEFAWLNKI